MSGADLALEPIAVVGLACTFPGARDADQFWGNVVEGRDAITEAPPDRLDPVLLATLQRGGAPSRGGFLPADALSFEPTRFGIMPVATEWVEPDQLLALRCAADALEDAGALDDVSHDRVGVILGRGGYLTAGGTRLEQRTRTADQLVACLETLLPEVRDEQLAEVRDAFCAALGTPGPEDAIGLVPNLAASRIANRLDLGGPAYTVDAACASSLVATDLAVSELRAGRCDVMLAGGVHHVHDITFWSVFSQLGALSTSGEIRPFSAHADGLLIGEGTGVIVLERLADAHRLGHRVYATLLGAGVSSDGRDTSLMNPRSDGQLLALERAYAAAGVDPAHVELVEGHGTATTVGDRAELDTLRRVFGKADDRARPGVLGSIKSAIGHAMPAAGAAGLIKAVLAVHHGVLPPTLGAEVPHPLVAETRFRLLRSAESWDAPLTERLAGVNVFGFGGINAHVVVSGRGATAPAPRRRSLAPARSEADPDEEPLTAVFLAGADAADLAAQLRHVDPATPLHPVLPQGGPARLAIVAPTAGTLELATRILEKGKPWRGRRDLWFEPRGLLTDGGRVAFVFPGLEPSFHTSVSALARRLGREAPVLPEGIGELEQQGREIFRLGQLLHEVLGDMRIRPDDIAGHSLGEWSGVFAAQMVDPSQADEFLDGLQPGSLEVPGVVYLVLGCGVETAGRFVSAVEGVTISHDNCPHQVIVCGPSDAIARVAEHAAAEQVLTQELPFRTGFHSPAFAPYLGLVEHHWNRMPLQAPTVPFWSATTCAPYPEAPDDVRALAAAHMVEPVRFRELTERLYAQGSRVFVQAGAGSTVGFVEDTLRDRPHLAIAASSAKHSGVSQLLRVAAACWVEGADADVRPLLAPHAARASATRGPRVDLRLSVPLVRLPPELRLTPAQTAPPPSAAPASAAGGALGAEHDALLADTVAASHAVLAALDGRQRVTEPTADVPPDPIAEPAPTSSTHTVRVGLDEQPWLADHAFYRQAAGWPHDVDRFPVMPMATMVEMLADAARRAAPGRVVTSIEQIRAFRWLPVAPAIDVVLRATPDGADRVDVAIEGFARATVVLGDRAPTPPAPTHEMLRGSRPSTLDADAIYRERWMFHGPRFQGLRRVDAVGDNGVDGEIEALVTPGATLDNAGQLYGWWVMSNVDRDFLALPESIERIELFRPLPAGARITTRVRNATLGDRSVRANIELIHEGAVAVRVTGWVSRRFESDPHLWEMLRFPEHRMLATVTPHGFAVVDERWRDGASRELMARRYLSATERAQYETWNPRAQRLRLLGRVAAKDALRSALWAEGHGEIFPAEVQLTNDERGAPQVVDGPAAGLPISIAHTEWLGVALVGARGGPPVGIDAEHVAPRGDSAISAVLSPAERAILDAVFGSARADEGFTRAWAAKEAVAKAAGTGLEGRPKDFVITDVDGDRIRVSGQWVVSTVVAGPAQTNWDTNVAPNRSETVPDATRKEYAIAWTDRT